eukprot:125730-Hanusia_phi.AAC.1
MCVSCGISILTDGIINCCLLVSELVTPGAILSRRTGTPAWPVPVGLSSPRTVLSGQPEPVGVRSDQPGSGRVCSAAESSDRIRSGIKCKSSWLVKSA